MSETAFDFAGLKFQEHLNVLLVVFHQEYFENFTIKLKKFDLSAFQIVKELDLTFCLKKETIFKNT